LYEYIEAQVSQYDIFKDKLENGAVNRSESLTDIFPTIKNSLSIEMFCECILNKENLNDVEFD
jgi:hypothetical protein